MVHKTKYYLGQSSQGKLYGLCGRDVDFKMIGPGFNSTKVLNTSQQFLRIRQM